MVRLRLAPALAPLLALGCAATAPPLPVARLAATPRWIAVVLGAAGGLDESDLTAVLVARRGRHDYVALDGGTLYAGVRRALAAGSFGDLPAPPADQGGPGWFLRRHVRGYLVSHPHLDHSAGLILNSPDDEAGKFLGGTAATLGALSEHVFNWRLWANFTDQGVAPRLARYRLLTLAPGAPQPLGETGLTVEAAELDHGQGYRSTAFLVGDGESYLLYLGDTGPDAVEGGGALGRLWERIAPLVRKGRLRGLFLECSYPDGRPDHLLFGHLTPRWIHEELARLAAAVDGANPSRALRGLPVVITHVKPSPRGDDLAPRLAAELETGNTLGVRYLLPRSGQRLEL